MELRLNSSSLWLSLFFFFFNSPEISVGSNVLTAAGKSLTLAVTLVSENGTFEMGFFTPGQSSYYAGIWYKQISPQTVIWVANREAPISSPDMDSAQLNIKGGNLVLTTGSGNSIWSTNLTSPRNSVQATLLETGNLVISDGPYSNATPPLWQSFDYPADTLMPHARLGYNKRTNEKQSLISWRNSEDPAPGPYSLEMDPTIEEYVVKWNGIEQYWSSGPWDGRAFKDIPNPMYNFSYVNNVNETYSTYFLNDPSVLSRFTITVTGQIQLFTWSNSGPWQSVFSRPEKQCDVYASCGPFGLCKENSSSVCECLPGFTVMSDKDWRLKDFSGGCARNVKLQCATNASAPKDHFDPTTNMKLPRQPQNVTVRSSEQCESFCLRNCSCTAYAYDSNNGCLIWNDEFLILSKDDRNGSTIRIRLALENGAVQERTRRNCRACGFNWIPYPLSTQPDCGDPLYSGFSCKESTGDLRFQTLTGSYLVTDIDFDTQRFVINVHMENSHKCRSRDSTDGVTLLKGSFPFNVTNWCYIYDIDNLLNQIEIGWNPPPEPTCSALIDCEDWPNSICNATKQRQGRCQCKSGFKWDALSLNCTSVMTEAGSSTERTKFSLKFISVIIFISVVLALVILCSIGYIIYKRNLVHERKDQENDLFTEDDKKAIDIPFYSLEVILAATDSFSDANKLGQGGFGPVYKGIFPGGQEIAVKRLLSQNGQGVNEFKNEIVLIAKLQHRNLVKLVGYCVTTNEKILLYEYMPNKSLDAILFDCTLSATLDWKMRFDIILGIARGLLYLHQDSRLRVIHRDLKASNILLDQEMNPKISDFGLARIVEGKSIEANTKKVVGTLGYMPPEYAMEGLFSIKSDVFSFGVVVLEIISGRRNTSFYQSQESLNLLGHAWKFWVEEKALDMMDPILLSSCNQSEVLKCINMGLLCVQEDPNDRPTMSNVVAMLVTENVALSQPKQPAFVARRRVGDTPSSSSSKKSNYSNNEVTTSVVEGR